jgi:preprotein translocase subunit SecF
MAASTGPIAFAHKLYRGETRIDFIGQRKKWYAASAVIILLCLAAMLFRGFNWGIDFRGGDQFQIPVRGTPALAQVRSAVEDSGVAVSSSQIAGSGSTQSYVIRTEKLTDAQRTSAENALASAAHVTTADITTNEVSSSWGSEVTRDAVIALVVFLVAVSIFMGFRFRDGKAAAAAVAALFHDLILTAGVYAAIHFEVTPGTVIGLLTILGYSLYDTVVVFDKVDENTKGLLGTSRHTYGEAANLAVNQTLMRSINTAIVALLPVGGLLVVGAGLLGAGTLKDLGLVLFVGMLAAVYSSIFFATPVLVDLKEAEPRFKAHKQRVLARRASGGGEQKRARPTTVRQTIPVAKKGTAAAPADTVVEDALAGSAPRPGARPAARKRPGSAKPGGGKPGGARSGGGRKR